MSEVRERVVECLKRLQIRERPESVPELDYSDAFVYTKLNERIDLRRASWTLDEERTRYDWEEFPAIQYESPERDGTVFVFDRGIFVCADVSLDAAAHAIEATVEQLTGSFVAPQSVEISVIPLSDGDHGKWDGSAFAGGEVETNRAWCPACDRVLQGTENYCPSCGEEIRSSG